MRLIDADEFLKYLGLGSKEARRKNFREIITFEDIEEQPTAYDVDKVVKQINEEISKTPEYKHKFCESVKEEHCSQYESCEDCMAEMMIEIVKSGGIAKR